jgi:hypothetical protein
MKMFKTILTFFLFSVAASAAEPDIQALEVDEAKVAQWNRFSGKMLELHKQLIDRQPVTRESSVGGYTGEFFNDPDYYVEEIYRREGTNLVVSKVQWEKDHPGNVHTMELYRYDENNRVSRDYLVAYLPWGRNAPIQALVNLHSYNEGLHSFRQFDASGELVYEHCKGSLNGKPVELSLEAHEIHPPRTAQEDYRACFSGLQQQAGRYLSPQ